MRVVTPLLALLLLAASVRAQTPGQCTLGVAQATLDASNVEASVFNTGSLFRGGTTINADGYIVPKALGVSPIFAASLWVGGRVNGQVRAAAARYTGFNFWPGPLDATGSPANPATCAAYDRIYTVSLNDVAQYEQTGTATADLAAWPVGLGAATVDAAGQPVVPTSLAQTIDLAAGERPVVYGSQTAFWVMNDVGNSHGPTNTPPIGIEVRVHAFVADRPETDLRRATFYRYELVYRGAAPLEDARLSLFVDPDLGNANDDFIGTDVSRGMAFVYNADNNDDGSTGYGVAPPAVGFDLLDGAGASSYFISGGGPATSDPTTGVQIYNYQQGLWADGSPMRAFGNGYQQTQGAVTTFAFPGDPVTGQVWSEPNNGTPAPNVPGDRRFAVSSPAFTLQPGQSRTFDIAILYARGGSNLASITALRQTSDRVQAMHDDGSLFLPVPEGPPLPLPGPTTLLTPADGVDLGTVPSVLLDWTPALGAEAYTVELALDAAFTVEVERIRTALDSVTVYPVSFLRQTRFWRVRAANGDGAGPFSDVRQYTVTGAYRPEVLAVEERDAAGAVIDPDLVGSLNAPSNRPPTYFVGAAGAASDDSGHGTPTGVFERLNFGGYLTANAPREYEIRWVDPTQGQVVLNRGWDRTTPGRAYLTCLETGTAPNNTAAPTNLVTTPAPVVGGYPRMPFQVWEIEPDGTERQVHANVIDDDSDLCYSFTTGLANSGAPPLAGFGYEQIYASRVPYVESELANPVDVHTRSNVLDAASQAFGRLTILLRQGVARPPRPGTRIRIVTNDDLSTAADPPPVAAVDLALEAARPNPVRGRATVRFTTAAAGTARLTLVDVLGRRVAVLVDGEQPAGQHEATLDGRRLAPGVYLLVLESGGARAVRPVTVVR